MPAITWSTALFMFKKLMPVVIDQAPELLRTFERRRTTAPTAAASMDQLALLQEQLETQSQLLTAQSDTLTQLHATLVVIRRSLRIAWIAVGLVTVLTLGLMSYVLLRP